MGGWWLSSYFSIGRGGCMGWVVGGCLLIFLLGGVVVWDGWCILYKPIEIMGTNKGC